MGGRGNNRNSSNSFYNSLNNGGRNTSYDGRSQPPHATQSTSNNYSQGRGGGNFHSRPPFWPNSFSNVCGFTRQPPPWGRSNVNNNPPWGRSNYRPQRPMSWDQNQQHRFTNPQGPWNSEAPPPPIITTHSTISNPASTFRFMPVESMPPPPPPPPLISTANSGSHLINFNALATAPKDTSKSATSVLNPPLGSKEERELRLEVAKKLLKKSLEESNEETSKITTVSSSSTVPSAGKQKKKATKPRPLKLNEGINKQSSSVPIEQVSNEHNVNNSSSAPPVTEEQRKRRVSLESNCVPSADAASKSTLKPTTPKRNRSNSLCLSAIPKTTEISTSSEGQNIKQRIIHDLLGMSKNTLNEIISNPRSRKFEYVMKYMMKESRWKQSQIQRQVAQAGIDSENSSCELVHPDYEDLLSGTDLAINLSNLPSEIIETLGNIFNLGSVSGSEYVPSEGTNLESDDISCLFDSNSPSYVKQIPCVDLSPPPLGNTIVDNNCCNDEEKVNLCHNLPKKGKKLTFDDHLIVPADINQCAKSDLMPKMPIEDTTIFQEPFQKQKSPEQILSPDSNTEKNTICTPATIFLVDDLGKSTCSKMPLDTESAEEAVLRLSRPEIDNFPMPMEQDGVNSLDEKMTDDFSDSTNEPKNKNILLEEENRENHASPSAISDLRNEDVKPIELQELAPVVEDTELTHLDPMFSTQSDSPTIIEDLASCSDQEKKDLEIVDADDDAFITNQSAMDEPLMSPDSFNGAIINNNEMMIMKSIDTVESDESLNCFGNSYKEKGSCHQPCMIEPEDMEHHPEESLNSTTEKFQTEGNPTTVIKNEPNQITPMQSEDGIENIEPKENQLNSTQSESQSEKFDIDVKKEKEPDLEIDEPNIAMQSSSCIEIGIQTDHSVNDPVFVAANDMQSIFKLLDSSAVPETDQIKMLLGHPASKSSRAQLQEEESTTSTTNNLECSSRLLATVKAHQTKPILIKSKNSICNSENPPPSTSSTGLHPVITAVPLVKPAKNQTANRQSKNNCQVVENHASLVAADSDSLASAAGMLKSLKMQIKGLKPKDKIKEIFLKITEIEKKVAVWTDIKNELYKLLSYILEDEKSQSASSSHEETVSSEVESGSSKIPTRSWTSAVDNSQLSPPPTKISRSGATRGPSDRPVQKPTDPNSELDALNKLPSKISPKRKRKRVTLTSRKKEKRSVKERLSTPEPPLVKSKLVTTRNESSNKSVTHIKIKSESDSSEENICADNSVGERSRSSKRCKGESPVVSLLSDSSPSPIASRKRTCTRQSAGNVVATSIPSVGNIPPRKTKAELKQMVFFPKPPERRTRRSSVSKTLNQDAELRLTRTQKGKSVVEQDKADPPIVILRSCRVVLHQLDHTKLQPKQTSDNESAVETYSVSSSDDDDELPLSALSKKKKVISPSVSSQDDIDISSVSSSDTASVKLHVSCPKSMKRSFREKSAEQHRHRHSSKHDPLVFIQHNQGAILDIKVVGKHVLAASEDGIVLSYSVKSGKLKKKYRGHSAAITCISIIRNESEPFYPEKMVTGSLDGQLRCFILKTGEQVHAPLQVGVTTAIDAEWGVIYLGTNKGEIAQANAKTFTMVGDISECSKEAIHALIATKEGPRRVLIVGSRNQAITVRDADTGLLLRSVSGGWQHTVYSLLLDNSLVYCGTKEGNVPAFDFTNGQEMFRLRAGNGVRCLKAYNGLIFAGCYDGFIYVFKGQTLVTKFAGGQMILSLDFTKNKVIFSSKDKLQALNFPNEVSQLLKESKLKKVK